MSLADEPCEHLPWDSEFFSVRIARVKGEMLQDDQVVQIDRWALSNGIQCLYFLARSDDPATVQTARRHGFELTDIRVTLERDSPSERATNIPQAPAKIRPVQTADLPTLQRLACALHRDTRFFCDPGFARKRCEDLYSTWITLDCQGRANRVFVAASPDEVPLGYISCHLQPGQRTGQIGLVGVGTDTRGKGIGRWLVWTALDWFAAEGALEVTVVTQGRNTPAQRLYQRCGFLTRQIQLWYHKWYTASGDHPSPSN